MLKTLRLLVVSSGALCSAKAPGRHFPGLQELYSHAEPTQLLDFSKGVDRFAPRTFEESIVAVYSTWNLLDRMVLTPGIHIVPWAFGMFLPVQVEKLVRLVRLRGVRTYCEVGFNGGHTAAAVLSATRDVTVRSFDIGEYGEHTSRNAKLCLCTPRFISENRLPCVSH